MHWNLKFKFHKNFTAIRIDQKKYLNLIKKLKTICFIIKCSRILYLYSINYYLKKQN